MNFAEAKAKTLNLLDEAATSSSAIADYIPKMPGYFDSAQKEAALVKPIRKSYKIPQYNPINCLGNAQAFFDLHEHILEDISFSGKGATSYYFEVDDIATIYIEECRSDVWTLIRTINHTESKYGVYKDTFKITDCNNMVRIRFSGAFYYHFRNIAMWDIPFSSSEKIPNFGEYAYYNVPKDFYKAEKITVDGEPTKNYYWENPKLLRLNYYNDGEFLLQYQAYPTTIDGDTPDTYEFEIDIEAQEALPYYVAAYCVVTEDQQYYVNFLSEYRGKLTNLDGDGIYGGGNENNGKANIVNTFFRGKARRGRRGL